MQETLSTIENYNSLRERIIHISKNLFKIHNIDLQYITNIEHRKRENKVEIQPYSVSIYKFNTSQYIHVTFLEDEYYGEGKTESYLSIPFHFLSSSDEEILSFIEEAKEKERQKEEEYRSKFLKENEIKHKEYIKSEYEKYFNKK
jgi:hypothetical protein